MPRSLRHKSHRQHRRNSSRGDLRERSDSDSEEERRRDDAVVSGSGPRDTAPEKSRGSCTLQGPEESNVVDVGRRGVKSADLFVVVDRWSGEDGHEVGQEVRVDELDEGKLTVGIEKAKGSGGDDWKEKTGARYDGSGGRKERITNNWDESAKRRSERDLSRSERSNQHGDVKERDREHFSDRDREHLAERRKDHDVKKDKGRELEKERECRLDKNREHRQERDREHRLKRSRDQVDDTDREHGMGRDATVVARERSGDHSSRKTGSRLADGEYMVKGNQQSDRREHEEIHNSDYDKDAWKKIRRRDYHGDKEKRYEDDRDITETKLSSAEDRVRNSSNKDEKYREERYREKFRDDFERDEKPRYDKHQDSRSSRDHASGRSDIKHNKDESKHTENHAKRRIEENGHESSPYDEHAMKYRDSRERKRFSDDIGYDSKTRNMKDPQMVETNISDSCTFEVTDDRCRLETAKVKDGADNNRPMRSFKSSSQSMKSEFRSLERAGATLDESWPEGQQSKNASGDSLHESIRFTNSVSVGTLDSNPMERKSTSKEHPHDDFLVENFASQIQTPQSDGYSSPVPSSERALSLSSGRRYSSKKDAMRHSGVEIEQKTNYSKDGRGYTEENKEQDFRPEKQEAANANLQMVVPNTDSFPVGSMSCCRADRPDPFSNCSPSPLRPSSSVRHGMGSPASGSDGDRFQSGDRKSNNRYKRLGDINISRGHGNATKGVLNWPSPVPNGFIPFQHGPPPGGFYPVVQPFASPMFGIRPPMDLNQGGNTFHMNENSDRFSGHSRPFGWRNPVDDPFPPNLQGWDGNNIFSDGSYVHCRSDWEQKNHSINNSGSEMSSELKGQNGNTVSPYLASEKEGVPSMRALEDEMCTGELGHQSTNELPNLKERKGTGDNHLRKIDKEISVKTILDNASVVSKLSDDKDAAFCSTCLSKLDISPDLSSPELYGQWAKTVENKGNKTIDDSVVAKNDGGTKLAVGVYGRAGTSLFPALSDDVFQRAVSLYRKDKETKPSAPLDLLSKEEEMDTSEISDADKIVPVDNISSYEANLPATDNACSSMEIDASKFDEPTKVVQDDLLNDADNLCESKNVQGDLPSVSQDGQSNISLSSASCDEGPLGCEAIIPECRVNLSRIHHSPESTH